MTVRNPLLKLHLYCALIAGVFILIISLTGALFVVSESIDHALNPRFFRVTPGGVRLPVERIVNLVRAAYPGEQVVHVRMPVRPVDTMKVALRRRLLVFVNPYTGDILGARDPLTPLLVRIQQFHTGRVAGPTGRRVVGIATIIALFLVVSGLYLWWQRKILKASPRTSFKRFNFDLHNVLGFYSAIILCLTLASGIVMSFETTIEPQIKRLDATPAPEGRPQSTPVPGARPISLDEAIAISERALPGAFTVGIDIVPPGPAAHHVLKRFPEDKTGGGRSQVFLDQFSGEVLRIDSSREAQLGTAMLNALEPIHIGNIYGWPTSALAAFASLGLAAQLVTGVYIWWGRGGGRRKKRTTPGVQS